jgi:hypothetical protein
MNDYTVIPMLTITILLGSALVLLPNWLRNPAAFHPDSRMGRLERAWVQLRTWLKTKFRYVDLGGYVHDTAMSQWISPNMCSYVTGAWADAVGAVTGTVVKEKTAADNTGVIYIPVSAALPSNSAAQKGSYLRSIDMWYAVTTAALDAAGATALIDKFTLPANGAAFAALSAQAFTYDTGNDTAAESDDLDEHKMTLTLTTPIWLDDDDLVQVRLTLDAAATSVVRFHGARANYTLRL